ncbi:MAG: PAS domain-containing protein, partial [Candidatus Bathyarchaeia archaeon]
AFKTGKKNHAEFWINLNNRLIHIGYFAVRDPDGKYLGTLEVSQDVTDIKKLEGERRLLDWTE